jgi:hypothetical protein
MHFVKASLLLFVATLPGLYGLRTERAYHNPRYESAQFRTTVDFTNDLIDYAQVLHSNQLQNPNFAAETSSFDNNFTTGTVTNIDEILQHAVYLNTSVSFYNCTPMFSGFHRYRPHPKLPNEEENKGRWKVVVQNFIQDAAIETVERCIETIDIAVQQHMYLRKLREATSDWIRVIGTVGLCDTHIHVGDRSYKITAGVTYLAIMLEYWGLENSGMCRFFVDIREMLLEENSEKARVAKAAAAARPGLFEEFKKALVLSFYDFAVFVFRE